MPVFGKRTVQDGAMDRGWIAEQVEIAIKLNYWLLVSHLAAADAASQHSKVAGSEGAIIW